MITRLREESGQAIVVTVLFMTVLLGATAMTLDVGSWYREHRQAQSAADAAALAGAQALPDDTVKAQTLAAQYASENGGGVDSVTFSGSFAQIDSVTVKITRPAPGFFSKLFDVGGTNVHARATARAAVPSEARFVAPIVVNKLHPLLAGPGCPCFDQETTLPLGKTGAPGAFALVNLDTSKTGAIGASTVADWIQNGFSQYLPLGDYFSDPGAKWNDSPIQDALTFKFAKELLFPVYDTLTGSGSNAEYHIIGWVGFHLESVTASGTGGSMTGWFTRVIWDGIQSVKNPNIPDFGVHSIALVN